MSTGVDKEISVELNNGMVLSNDLTLKECKLKCKLFSAVNTYEYPLHYTMYSMNNRKSTWRTLNEICCSKCFCRSKPLQ